MAAKQQGGKEKQPTLPKAHETFADDEELISKFNDDFVVSIRDYVPEFGTEVELQKGDILEVIKREIYPDTWYVKNRRTGAKGIISCFHVEELHSSEAVP